MLQPFGVKQVKLPKQSPKTLPFSIILYMPVHQTMNKWYLFPVLKVEPKIPVGVSLRTEG